jgi:hypothetical protein
MRTKQWQWGPEQGWSQLASEGPPPSFVFVFGGREALEQGTALEGLSAVFPRETLFGCSTAGEIAGPTVHDDTAVATAVWLERSAAMAASVHTSEAESATALGRLLARRLTAPELKHVLILSDGTQVNGSELVRGLIAELPPSVTISGGLSGDGVAMKRTVVVNAGDVRSGTIVALGFSGHVTIGTGSVGGWDAFGPRRRVTKARGNVLEELDGERALELYKRYLGPHSQGLPSSALLFPLLVQAGDTPPVVRTILGVDDAAGTMTFAGDVPVGSTVQLMRANFDRLIGAGEGAATASLREQRPELALLVSCVGRKLILKQRVEEELEAVRSVLGDDVTTTGFYSYGELAPSGGQQPCQLHNQTMTVTTFSER